IDNRFIRHATATNVTVAGNVTLGIRGLTALRNSIVWGNGADCSSVGEVEASIDRDATRRATTTDPQLGPLADNGGGTRTMAPAAGRPAHGAGGDAACPAADQRGIGRPQGAHCDIGAVEVTAAPPP